MYCCHHLSPPAKAAVLEETLDALQKKMGEAETFRPSEFLLNSRTPPNLTASAENLVAPAMT